MIVSVLEESSNERLCCGVVVPASDSSYFSRLFHCSLVVPVDRNRPLGVGSLVVHVEGDRPS